MSKAGKYATWGAPLNYHGIHQMQENLGWIDSNNKCVRDGDLCQTVVCPEGTVRKTCDAVYNGCVDLGLSCPTGYDCLCSPCAEVIYNFPPRHFKVL